MTIRPLPGPPSWGPLPEEVKPRYVDVDDVAYTATCDRGGHDAVWRKTRDAVRPTCTCTCRPADGVP